jgi:hypothetical protein
MADETLVCLNPTVPEDEPTPGRTHKYKKLATNESSEHVSLLCVLNVACILFVSLVLIAAVSLLVVIASDPCIVSICDDFIVNGSIIKT